MNIKKICLCIFTTISYTEKKFLTYNRYINITDDDYSYMQLIILSNANLLYVTQVYLFDLQLILYSVCTLPRYMYITLHEKNSLGPKRGRASRRFDPSNECGLKHPEKGPKK